MICITTETITEDRELKVSPQPLKNNGGENNSIVAKLVYALDLKSSDPKGSCGFNSRRCYNKNVRNLDLNPVRIPISNTM